MSVIFKCQKSFRCNQILHKRQEIKTIITLKSATEHIQDSSLESNPQSSSEYDSAES
jgi:hypothetical protein